MPTRSTTNYIGHTMTEMEIKQANKTTMFVLGGLRRPKEAWIVTAQAQKDLEDAQQRSVNKRKAPEPIAPPNAKRSRKAVVSQEEKDQKLQEQRARYNEKRRKARAELRKKKQTITRQKDTAQQPKAAQPSVKTTATKEPCITHTKISEQQMQQNNQPQQKELIDLTGCDSENSCTNDELADLIAAELDDIMENEEHMETKGHCRKEDEWFMESEAEGSTSSPGEEAGNNERKLSSASEPPEDVANESSEESEEE